MPVSLMKAKHITPEIELRMSELHYKQGMTAKEIAKEFGYKIGTVKGYLNKPKFVTIIEGEPRLKSEVTTMTEIKKSDPLPAVEAPMSPRVVPGNERIQLRTGEPPVSEAESMPVEKLPPEEEEVVYSYDPHNEFERILRESGIRTGRGVISRIFFDGDINDAAHLWEILMDSNITEAQSKNIMRAWFRKSWADLEKAVKKGKRKPLTLTPTGEGAVEDVMTEVEKLISPERDLRATLEEFKAKRVELMLKRLNKQLSDLDKEEKKEQGQVTTKWEPIRDPDSGQFVVKDGMPILRPIQVPVTTGQPVQPSMDPMMMLMMTQMMKKEEPREQIGVKDLMQMQTQNIEAMSTLFKPGSSDREKSLEQDVRDMRKELSDSKVEGLRGDIKRLEDKFSDRDTLRDYLEGKDVLEKSGIVDTASRTERQAKLALQEQGVMKGMEAVLKKMDQRDERQREVMVPYLKELAKMFGEEHAQRLAGKYNVPYEPGAAPPKRKVYTMKEQEEMARQMEEAAAVAEQQQSQLSQRPPPQQPPSEQPPRGPPPDLGKKSPRTAKISEERGE